MPSPMPLPTATTTTPSQPGSPVLAVNSHPVPEPKSKPKPVDEWTVVERTKKGKGKGKSKTGRSNAGGGGGPKPKPKPARSHTEAGPAVTPLEDKFHFRPLGTNEYRDDDNDDDNSDTARTRLLAEFAALQTRWLDDPLSTWLDGVLENRYRERQHEHQRRHRRRLQRRHRRWCRFEHLYADKTPMDEGDERDGLAPMIESAICLATGSFSPDWPHRMRGLWQLVLFDACVRKREFCPVQSSSISLESIDRENDPPSLFSFFLSLFLAFYQCLFLISIG